MPATSKCSMTRPCERGSDGPTDGSDSLMEQRAAHRARKRSLSLTAATGAAVDARRARISHALWMAFRLRSRSCFAASTCSRAASTSRHATAINRLDSRPRSSLPLEEPLLPSMPGIYASEVPTKAETRDLAHWRHQKMPDVLGQRLENLTREADFVLGAIEVLDGSVRGPGPGTPRDSARDRPAS
jgi:hypothetical protein